MKELTGLPPIKTAKHISVSGEMLLDKEKQMKDGLSTKYSCA